MKHTNKTEGKTSQSITFKADWLDFTEHLTNAQVGRYRAQIIIDGKRYRYTSQDKAEVEAWLEGMRKWMEK